MLGLAMRLRMMVVVLLLVVRDVARRRALRRTGIPFGRTQLEALGYGRIAGGGLVGEGRVSCGFYCVHR